MKVSHVLGLMAVLATGCEYQGSPEQVEGLLEPPAQYEPIALPVHEYGLYKFYDLQEQKVCYLYYDAGRAALDCDPIQRSADYEAPGSSR